MRKFDVELAVGLFIIVGLICLGYLSIRLGRMEVIGGEGYDNVSGSVRHPAV